MGLSVQMALKKNMLIIRLKGELDEASAEKLKYRVSEVIDKYMIAPYINQTDEEEETAEEAVEE